ncbi:Uncharacterised protein [Shigella sonnei]|nr:Uncharacterised protein [Shigella sonnei]
MTPLLLQGGISCFPFFIRFGSLINAVIKVDRERGMGRLVFVILPNLTNRKCSFWQRFKQVSGNGGRWRRI